MASRSRARKFKPLPLPDGRSQVTRQRRIITVSVPLPVSVARRVRTVSYPYPKQQQRRSRVIRIPLRPRPERFVTRRVRVVLPRTLPVLAASYVSLTDNQVNIHSNKQTRRLMKREFNRRRYQEHKTRSRKARHGQIESLKSDPLGIVGEAARRGLGARALADAALVSRALRRSR